MLTPAVAEDRVAVPPVDGLLRLRVVCPSCGKSPVLRVTPEAKEQWQGVNPEQVVMTYACHAVPNSRAKCRTIYKIRARCWQEAY